MARCPTTLGSGYAGTFSLLQHVHLLVQKGETGVEKWPLSVTREGKEEGQKELLTGF